jgi:hypothetical protein
MDSNLRQFATDAEWAQLTAVEEHGSRRAAAKALGIPSENTIRQTEKRVQRRAAQQGYMPSLGWNRPIPAGMRSRGPSIRVGEDGNPMAGSWDKIGIAGRDPEEAVKLADPKVIKKLSTNIDEQGNIRQQWVQEVPADLARKKLWEAFRDELTKDLPRVKPTKAPKNGRSDLCSILGVGDQHMGMLAWDKESGDDYDLNIAEPLLVNSISHLIGAAPKCSTCVLVFIGDYTHYDGHKPVTPTHGYILDADSRYPKMVAAAVRTMRRSIDMALAHHDKVHVIIEIGNHDLATSVFLQVAMQNIYDREPRVFVDTSPKHFHFFRFGLCLLGTHHGHGVKMDKLPLLMATDRPEDWGATKYRLWLTGHVHHESKKEHPGCKVESLSVLAPTDSHAYQNGYRALREMRGIVWHERLGELSRNTVSPAMFEQAP